MRQPLLSALMRCLNIDSETLFQEFRANQFDRSRDVVQVVPQPRVRGKVAASAETNVMDAARCEARVESTCLAATFNVPQEILAPELITLWLSSPHYNDNDDDTAVNNKVRNVEA